MIPTHDPLTTLSQAPAPVEQLRGALIDRADGEGLVDAVFSYAATPIGALFVAATPTGIVRLGFEQEQDPISALVGDVGPRVLQLPPGPDDAGGLPGAGRPPRQARGDAPGGAAAIVARAAAELAEYFAGNRREFTVPIDLRVAGFRGEVVHALPTIGYGSRESYKDLAARVGNPGAVRAVGSACANNPIPIFVPCHRVVRSDGSWGHYRGGVDAKTFLLDLEQASA